MVANLQMTLLFTGLLVAISVPMSVAVGLRRAKTGIQLLHGEDDELLRRIRAHANFTEYVPLALLALGAAELSGAPAWLVLGCGSLLLLARLVHYVSLRRAPMNLGRAVGSATTALVMLVLALSVLFNLWQGLPA